MHDGLMKIFWMMALFPAAFIYFIVIILIMLHNEPEMQKELGQAIREREKLGRIGGGH